MEGESLGGFTTDPNNPDVMVSLFEDSIENHFRAMDTISKLCGEKEENEASYASDEKFSSTITFLREWKHYCYKPRTVKFTCEVENPQGKDVLNALVLPQFSAASVPKLGSLSSDQTYLKASKDSVMYVGGPVWALDWCPSVHQRSDSPIKCEYLAVAAHPPESSYHKIGVPLTGRGVVQVWCLLNANLKEEDSPPVKKPERPLVKKPERRGRPRKNAVVEEKCDLDKEGDGISPLPKKAKGRPRKKVEESIGDLDRNIRFDQALVHLDKETEKISPPPLKKARGRPRKKTVIEECIVDLDDNDQSVQAQSVQLDKGAKKISLPLEKARGGPRKKMLTEECTGDSDINDHLAQAPSVQLDKGTENVSLPLERASGRQGKKSVFEESIGDLDGNQQFVQALVVQLDKTIEEISPPLKKARGRPRKKKGVKRTHHDLDIDGQTVPALAVEFPEDQAGIPSETGQVYIYHEQEVLKNPDTDVEFERETQQGFSDTGVACKSGHNILRLEEDKAKTVSCHEVLESPDTDVELGRETQQDFKLAFKSGHNIPRPNRKAKDRARAWIELQINDDGGEVEGEKQPCLNSTEVSYKPGESIRQPKKKMKNKSRAGNNHDDIHPHFLSKHAEKQSPIAAVQAAKSCDQDPMPSSQTALNGLSLDTNTPNLHLPKEVALPRIVLCLAHNGKVAWDVKWRPSSMDDKRCMGYLAVLLGNGSLEVWEVPFPGSIKVLYSSDKRENTDPRFVKLAPVFRCSNLKCGDRQSIPLTLEWSPSAPHDLILAGCHDGTVALWKFSPSGSSQVADTRPLLYFTADTVPIRALAWAPDESDAESANVVVTAGHGSVRFWDLRDPYRPLWELNPGGRRGVYSLDWLPDPRCIIMSFDDGTVRFLSMLNSANDVPVTGKPFDGTQQQGLHSYPCSSFPIWSIQVSKLTGLVAYSTADGSVLRFQLTSKAVDKDPSRNRAPHFLCASLTAEEDSTIKINTPLPNTPYPMNKSLNECGDTPRSMRRFLSDSNQAKRTHDKTSEEPNLALCYGDDPLLSGYGDTTPLGMQKTNSASKPKVPRKKTPTLDMVCSYREETETLQGEENHKDEKGNEIEASPSKLVAMHRVRWNMNKGSERWLCYGGAAGIVRCQEFSVHTIKECALIKR